MNQELLIVLVWLAGVISLLVLIQVALLVALSIGMLRLFSKILVVERKLRASGIDFYDALSKTSHLLGHLEIAMRESAEMGHSLNEGLSEVRFCLARLEHSATDLIEEVGGAVSRLQRIVNGPAAQFRALVAAVRTVWGALGRGRASFSR